VLYRDGVPVAKRLAGEIVLLDADPALQKIARDRLVRDPVRVVEAGAAPSPEEE
jgi:hypothetical protein